VIAAILALAAASAPLSDAEVRAFVARQERAWNAGDLDAYFAAFAPSALFADKAANGAELITYGVSTVAEARANSRRLMAKSTVRETGQVLTVNIGPGGAKVLTRVVTRIETSARVRMVCADRVQEVRPTPQGLKSFRQTDYIRRCPR